MSWLLDSMKARAMAALVLFLAASQLLAPIVFVSRSGEANNLLHDALVAEQIAQIAKIIERIPESERADIIRRLSWCRA